MLGRQMLRVFCLISSCCLLVLIGNPVCAKLTKVEVLEQTAFEYQQEKYESVSGYFYFQFDPSDSLNQRVTDIEFASKDESGMVAAKASFYLIQPSDEQVKGTLFEISNRGSKASLRYFNNAARNAMPSSEESLGDGLIQDLGLRVLWVGWQADVPVNKDTMHVMLPVAKGVEGLVRSDWTLEENTTELLLSHRPGIEVIYPFDNESAQPAYLTKRLSRNGQRSIVDRETWEFNNEGSAITGSFSSGIYELVYPSNDPVVVGLGLAILRDTATYLKSSESQFPSQKVIGFGVSQTGRLLRHFLYQGFNETSENSKAFDGMLIHTSGAGRGSFNHRFGQPSRDAHRFSAFFYPTDIFPFTSRPTQNLINRELEGLLDKQSSTTRPKIFYTNTGYEYWGRAASLIHTASDKDILPLENERIFHLASGQNFVERIENLKDIGNGVYRGNPLDFLTNLRALLSSLSAWVIDGSQPPDSQFPQIENQELTNIQKYQLPEWLTSIDVPQSPHSAYLLDYSINWQHGVIDNQPPRLLAEIIPFVPTVDRWGNEVGGLRHPYLEEPLAAFLPWSLRDQGFSPNEMRDFRGMMVLMQKQDVLARYQDWATYQAKLNTAINKAIERNEILPRDRERLVIQANWIWSKIMDD